MLIQDTKTDICTNRFGGNGDVIIEHYIEEKLLNDSVVMYAKVILKPGCSLGYHTHNGNSETIVVLQGIADYNDNGTPMTLHAGDKVHCPSGESHSIGNPADAKEDLLLQALVIKTN
ncbi:cupin domain-containing protein [uncultured Phascolarctobacterium sp.]|jgi:quercetin dioxygenase-like cupin family protein|uniref:cupin domain-containing protein n=1 Tax=uncultured Phascolarctobacterium sp. TaxID=512296 RepID=UPI0025E6258E|nr:cupin domain-containing protein [uncultured Phascolarctobacterium sp.]